MPEITDELFAEAAKAYCRALPGFPSDAVHADLSTDAVGLRAALSVAFAAGRESAYEGGEIEWRSGTSGLTWLTEPEDIARNRAKTWAKSGGFVEMRHVGPWTRVEVAA